MGGPAYIWPLFPLSPRSGPLRGKERGVRPRTRAPRRKEAATATDRIVNEWIDGAGGFLRTAGWIDSTVSSGPLLTAMQAASNAELLYSEQGLPRTATASPNPGVTWWLCTDTAIFTFICLDLTNVGLIIPGPDSSMFLPGSLVIDPASTLAAAIIAQAIGVVLNPVGSPVTAFVSGVKSSRRTEQNAPP